MEKHYIKNDNNRIENPCLTQGEDKKRGRRGEEEAKKRLRRGREECKHDVSRVKDGLKQRLRLQVLRVAVVLGVMMAWMMPVMAQDYSGVYYIANKIYNGNHNSSSYWYNNLPQDQRWYLVPAADPHQINGEDAYYSSDYTVSNGSSDKPFLTTYQTNCDNNSIWIFEKTGNKYYIIHALTGKYVKYEPPTKVASSGSYQNNPENRRSMHLEAVEGDTPGNEFKYSISVNTENNITGYNIKPTKSNGTNVNGYFNPAGENWEYYYAHTKKDGYWVVGLVGYYNSTGGGSLWPWEDAKNASVSFH